MATPPNARNNVRHVVTMDFIVLSLSLFRCFSKRLRSESTVQFSSAPFLYTTPCLFHFGRSQLSRAEQHINIQLKSPAKILHWHIKGLEATDSGTLPYSLLCVLCATFMSITLPN